MLSKQLLISKNINNNENIYDNDHNMKRINDDDNNENSNDNDDTLNNRKFNRLSLEVLFYLGFIIFTIVAIHRIILGSSPSTSTATQILGIPLIYVYTWY